MKCTVCIPKRKSCVVVKVFCPVDIQIEPFILPVGIHIKCGTEKSVIHCCIKIYLLTFSCGFCFNFAQFPVPDVLSLFFNFFEIPARNFCCHIFNGPVCAHRGYGYFKHYFFTLCGIKIKVGSHLSSCHLRKVFALIEFPPETFVNSGFFEVFIPVAFEWFGKRDGKINRTGSCPSACLPESCYCRVILNPQNCPYIFAVIIVNSGNKVKNYMGVIRFWKCISVHSHS